MVFSLYLNNCSVGVVSLSPIPNPNFNCLKFSYNPKYEFFFCTSIVKKNNSRHVRLSSKLDGLGKDSDPNNLQEKEVDNPGVKAALSMLKFYKREISPLLPNSCRYVPTCSEYSMIAYKKYGFVKGTVLTAWRLCRCNPLGGSGFDPPRWFGETSTPDQ